MACQILFNPKRTEHLGVTDGECMERLWSFLGKFSSITKEMTSENKMDLLVDGLLHYAHKIRHKLDCSLLRKLKRAEELGGKSRKMLQEIITPLSNVNIVTVQKWSVDEVVRTESQSNKKDKVEYTWDETYVHTMENLDNLRHNRLLCDTDEQGEINEKISRLGSQLEAVEKKHGFTRWSRASEQYKKSIQSYYDKNCRTHLHVYIHALAQERKFYIELIRKYARGQSVAKRLNNQIKRVNKNIKKKLQIYNNLQVNSSDEFRPLEFNTVIDLEDNVWKNMEAEITADYPSGLKRLAIDAFELNRRSIEEIEMLKVEMRSCVSY